MAVAKRTEVDRYLTLPYRMGIYWDNDYWAVEFPELPGLAADSETWEGLPQAIEEAKRAWFEGMLEEGLPIPEPRGMPEHSGKLQLRLPKSLHAQAAQAAEREGASLNSFLVAAIARELGRRSLPEAPDL